MLTHAPGTIGTKVQSMPGPDSPGKGTGIIEHAKFPMIPLADDNLYLSKRAVVMKEVLSNKQQTPGCQLQNATTQMRTDIVMQGSQPEGTAQSSSSLPSLTLNLLLPKRRQGRKDRLTKFWEQSESCSGTKHEGLSIYYSSSCQYRNSLDTNILL